MNYCKALVMSILIGLFSYSHANNITDNTVSTSNQDSEKKYIVSLGGDITEIIYALGAEAALVGVDTTSQWPEQTRDLPKVGYFRALSAEGILSLNPDLVIMSDAAGPPSVIEQLKSAGLSVITVANTQTPEGILNKVNTVASALNAPLQGEQLSRQIKADFQALESLKKHLQDKPRVAFLFSVAKGNLLASGTKTAADAMIRLAGGVKVFVEYPGYKPVNSETLVAAKPDVLLLTDRVLDSLGGLDNFINFPGISQTPAGITKRIIIMDTLYLLGFGPRTGKAALELIRELYPEFATKKNHD